MRGKALKQLRKRNALKQRKKAEYVSKSIKKKTTIGPQQFLEEARWMESQWEKIKLFPFQQEIINNLKMMPGKNTHGAFVYAEMNKVEEEFMVRYPSREPEQSLELIMVDPLSVCKH